MKWFLASAVLCLFLVNPPPATAAGAVLRVQVVDALDSQDGTCFLIRQQGEGDTRTSFFLTSGRLFHEHGPTQVRIFLDDGRVLDVAQDDIHLPTEGSRDVAVLAVTTPDLYLEPMPVVFDQVPADDVFVIPGYGRDGTDAVATGQVQLVSARLIRGTRDASHLVAPAGAPAMNVRGVFGVVVQCESDCVPLVVPLSAVRSFLEREVPGFSETPALEPQFTVTTRTVEGPLLEVPFGETSRGEVDVPFGLSPGELVFSASAELAEPRSITLGDLTVVSLDDRAVKVRFLLGGAEQSPQTAFWPQGQALVSVRLQLVTMLKR